MGSKQNAKVLDKDTMLCEIRGFLVLFIITLPSLGNSSLSLGLHVCPSMVFGKWHKWCCSWPKIIGSSVSTWIKTTIRFSCNWTGWGASLVQMDLNRCKPGEILDHCKLLILCWLERRQVERKESSICERERGKRSRCWWEKKWVK